jgi:sialic acid synthase SpsE
MRVKSLKREIESGQRLVIAEIGINHNGDFEIGQELIQKAFNSGCKAIKFQYRNLNRAYGSIREIGDEIIETEIRKNYFAPSSILELGKYAKDFGLFVGISFFTMEDIADFGTEIFTFDFYKVPSVEHQNIDLINKLCSIDSEKIVFIATGMATEQSIKQSFTKIQYENWMPLHCVSNYPVAFFNSQLGYISTLASNWNRRVGYSSHDSNWGMCLVALSLGAQVIERHITLDKDSFGLDHTSSSTPEEITLLCEIVNNFDDCIRPVQVRRANQGEKLNEQNLGRSLYATRDIQAGEKFNIDDFDYLSPQTGLKLNEVEQLKNATFLRKINISEVVTKSHFTHISKLPTVLQEFADEFLISLPVRIHDFSLIRNFFGISNYEFHLSYKELGEKALQVPKVYGNKFTLHLPDYCSSNSIIDPLSADSSIRTESLKIIKKGIEFAKSLEDQTGHEVGIVGSFSKCNTSNLDFYSQFVELIHELVSNHIKLSLQWLPPIAWYFGGSVRLDVMNNLDAVKRLLETKLPIVMDTSHLFLGSEYFGFEANSVFSSVLAQTSWFHISSSSGIDGEGNGFQDIDSSQSKLIRQVVKLDKPKVIEVWQGHLNNFEGFHLALRDLYSLMKSGHAL